MWHGPFKSILRAQGKSDLVGPRPQSKHPLAQIQGLQHRHIDNLFTHFMSTKVLLRVQTFLILEHFEHSPPSCAKNHTLYKNKLKCLSLPLQIHFKIQHKQNTLTIKPPWEKYPNIVLASLGFSIKQLQTTKSAMSKDLRTFCSVKTCETLMVDLCVLSAFNLDGPSRLRPLTQ